MDIKTADDALKMYRWAAKKWHEELDAAAAIALEPTQPSEWKRRKQKEFASSAGFNRASKFNALKSRYWAAYMSLGGLRTRGEVDQEAGRSHRSQRA